jgi:protein-glutamine gamma-glutamyltransferase
MSATTAPVRAPTAPVAAKGVRSEWVELACFAALAAWGAAHWELLVADADGSRTAGGIAVAVGGATALLLLARARVAAPLRLGLAAAVGAATVAIGLIVAGLSAGLLKPARWDELGDGLDRGLSGLYTVEWPYAGEDPWIRLVVLMGAPLLMGLAATLSFWPSRRARPGLRAVGLVLLLVLYGTPMTELGLDAPLLRGLVLLMLVAAWLWLPRLGPLEAGPAAALVLAVGIVAVPVAARLDGEQPWWDYKEWNWFGSGKAVSFDWNHTYGPLNWPREGTTLLNVRSNRSHYWKVETLDRFDGFRWVRSQQTHLTTASELPDVLNPAWDERIRVTVRALRTDFIVGVGTTYRVEGVDNVVSSGDGTSRVLGEPLERGDSYDASGYAPNPTADQMRQAGTDYDPSLSPYTGIYLPEAGENALVGSGRPENGVLGRESVSVGLRGQPATATFAARDSLMRSPYADTYQLARRLTADAPTVYEAVKNIERHLQQNYTYGESVPDRGVPLAAFLFRDRRGYCQQFSGAMALMLRMAGIPARVTGGFSPGSFNRDTREWRVRDLDAHSWVEVNFPGIGWVPFDPTPPAAPAESQSGGAGAISAARGDTTEGRPDGAALSALSSQGGPGKESDDGILELWMVPLAVLAALAAWVAVVVVLDRRRHDRLSAAARADAQLRELERALRRLGWPLPARSTLLGLERRLGRAAGPASASYVAGIRAYRFAPDEPPTPGRSERRALRRELAGRGGLLGRLRGYRALPPFLRAHLARRPTKAT